MKKYFIILTILLSALTSAAHARELKFEVSVDRSDISIGERVTMGLSFQGTQNVPAPDLGAVDGLDIRYMGPSTMMTVINGQVSSSITHMYALTPLRNGKFQLGPYTFSYQGDRYTSSMAFLSVQEGKTPMPAPSRLSPVQQEEKPLPADLDNRLFVTLEAAKTTAYVNELIPVTVKMYVDHMNVSDIQLPTFGQEGFSKAEFKEPKQYREERNGRIFDVLEFSTNIFGTRAGDYKIGPAKIKANVIVRRGASRGSAAGQMMNQDPFFDDFFTRYEKTPVELKSEETKFTVLPLPVEGRPADFTGAVGDYQFIFDANPKSVKVGDPITLRMEINGAGNFNTVLPPKLDPVTDFNLYEPEIKTDQNKVFIQVIIPETDRVTETPKAIFTYFDPGDKKYKSISQGPISIKVEKSKDQAPAQVFGPAPVPAGKEAYAAKEPERDIIYIKESMGDVVRRGERFYGNAFFLAMLPLPLILLSVYSIVMARRRRIRVDKRYAGRVMAYVAAKKGVKRLRKILKAADQRAFYEAAFMALQTYLGGKLGLPAVGVTYGAVEETLKKRNVDLNILRKIERLFKACDEARFAFTEVDELRKKDDLKDLEEVIVSLERMKL